MNKKQKLELTWIGKENRPRLEPRILLEDPEKSYHAPHRVSDKDQFDNRLIFGDNLLTLKALEQEFLGKIKCIFIDPPYSPRPGSGPWTARHLAGRIMALLPKRCLLSCKWTRLGRATVGFQPHLGYSHAQSRLQAGAPAAPFGAGGRYADAPHLAAMRLLPCRGYCP